MRHDVSNFPDWVSTNETDGAKFYGYDDGEGRTAWYDKDGNGTNDYPRYLTMNVI